MFTSEKSSIISNSAAAILSLNNISVGFNFSCKDHTFSLSCFRQTVLSWKLKVTRIDNYDYEYKL